MAGAAVGACGASVSSRPTRDVFGVSRERAIAGSPIFL